jgi:magnesium-transporting ATPase (P-type)
VPPCGWARRILFGIVCIHLCVGLFVFIGAAVMLGIDEPSSGAGLPLGQRAVLLAVDWSLAIYFGLVLSDVVALWALSTRRPIGRSRVVQVYVAAVLLLAAAHVAAVAIATRIETFDTRDGAVVLHPSMWQAAAIWGGLMIVPAVLTGAAAIMERRQFRNRGACPACGYDLTGLPGPDLPCPECGRSVSEKDAARRGD